jgi:hypothetical protein
MTGRFEENPPNSPNGNYSAADKKHDAFEKATLATAIIGVVFLIAYTVLTGYQAYLAKDTAQRQLRAYVSAIVEKHPDLDGSSPPEVGMVFKNNGQTPAYKVEARFVVYLGREQLSESDIGETKALLDKLRKSASILFPGQEFRTSSVPGIGIPLTSDDKAEVAMGARVLWVVGEVTYVDAFGYDHFTRFRLYMGGINEIRYRKFIWADEGNEAN